MNAPAYDILRHPTTAAGSTLSVPAELGTFLEESPKMKASFSRLTDSERRGFVRFVVDDSSSAIARERRAVIVAKSLMGLACDLRDDGSPIDASPPCR